MHHDLEPPEPHDSHDSLNRLAIGLALVVMVLLAAGAWHNRRRSRERRRTRLRQELERLERRGAPVRERAFLITELRALGLGSRAERDRLDRIEAELDREVRRDRLTRRLDSELETIRALPEPALRAERLKALLKVAGDIPKVALAVARELDDVALCLTVQGTPSRPLEEEIRALLARTPGGTATLTAALRDCAVAAAPPGDAGPVEREHGRSALRTALLAEKSGDLEAAATSLPSIADGLRLHETYAFARLLLDVGRPVEALALAENLAFTGAARKGGDHAPGKILAAIVRIEARCDLGEPEAAKDATARLEGSPFGDARAALARAALLRFDIESLERILGSRVPADVASGSEEPPSGASRSPVTALEPDEKPEPGIEDKPGRSKVEPLPEPAGVALARGRLERLYRADDRALAAFDHALSHGSARLRLEAALRKAVVMARTKRGRAAGEMLSELSVKRPGDPRLEQLIAELALSSDRLNVAESILTQARRAGRRNEALELVVLRVRWRRLRQLKAHYRAEAWDAVYRDLRDLSGRCLHKPALADVFGLLGFLEEKRGDVRAAERNYTTALRLAGPAGDRAMLRWDDRLYPPRRAPWRAYRGFLLETSFGKPAAAIEDFEAFQRILPGPSKLGERVAAALMRCRAKLADSQVPRREPTPGDNGRRRPGG